MFCIAAIALGVAAAALDASIKYAPSLKVHFNVTELLKKSIGESIIE
ncbi:MAG: hypothetical protein R6U91_03260 [Bacillota bacterium]